MAKPEINLAQLHTHPVESDGLVTIPGLLEQARSLGIGFLGITAHDLSWPGNKARIIAGGNNLQVKVIAGIEITASLLLDHILALFPEEAPKFSQEMMFMGVEKTVDWIHENGGVAILAHPRTSVFFLLNPKTCNIFDGIETLTPVNGKSGRNKRVERILKDQQSPGVALIGSGDLHHLNDQGWNCLTEFSGLTVEELFQAIKDKKTTPIIKNFSLPPVPGFDILQKVNKSLLIDPKQTHRVGAYINTFIKILNKLYRGSPK